MELADIKFHFKRLKKLSSIFFATFALSWTMINYEGQFFNFLSNLSWQCSSYSSFLQLEVGFYLRSTFECNFKLIISASDSATNFNYLDFLAVFLTAHFSNFWMARILSFFYKDDFLPSREDCVEDLIGKYFFTRYFKMFYFTNFIFVGSASCLGLGTGCDHQFGAFMLPLGSWFELHVGGASWQYWFARPFWLGSWRRFGTSVLNSGRHNRMAGPLLLS